MASRVPTKSAKPLGNKSARAERQKALDRTLKPRASKAAKAKSGKGPLLELEDELAKTPEWICGWDFELAARAEGASLIAGVDEVGRGPLFGPVVAAAVILPEDCCLDGLNDSKKLSEEERERFDAMVREVALGWAIAEVDV